jgi:hypothetical protein
MQNRIVGAGLALVAVLGAYWFFALAPTRADVAKVRDEVTQAEARRVAAVGAAASAERTRAAYQRDYANLARLGKAAPPDDDVASLVYQLETLARANKVDFRAVKLTGAGATAPTTPATSGRSSAEPAGGTSSDSGADSSKDAKSEDATTPAAPAAPVIAQAPPGAVVGSAGLITLPFTFTFDGGYLPMQRMLGAIDRLAANTDGAISLKGRLLTVDGFALAASRFGFPKIKATVSATAYIVPPAEGITAGATPQGPAAGAVSAGGSAGAGSTASPTSTATIQGVG